MKLAYLLRFLRELLATTSCEPLFQTFGGVQWRTQNERSLPICKQDEGRIDSQSATSSSNQRPFFWSFISFAAIRWDFDQSNASRFQQFFPLLFFSGALGVFACATVSRDGSVLIGSDSSRRICNSWRNQGVQFVVSAWRNRKPLLLSYLEVS